MTRMLSTCLVTVAMTGLIAGSAAGYELRVVETVEHVREDQTIAADTALRFAGGGFEVAREATLTIRGSIDAPCQQVFSGKGRVIIAPGRVAEVYPQWFGAAGDGEHDDTAAIQAALDALPEGGVIRFAPGRYANTGMTVHSHQTLRGALGASTLLFTGKEGGCLTLPKDCSWFRVEQLALVAQGQPDAYGVDGRNEYVRHFSMRDFQVVGFKTGVYVPAGMSLLFEYGYIGCYGQGAANGTVSLKLGDKATSKACTTATISHVYLTNAETCFYNRAAPCVMVRPIFETCQIGLDSYTRATVIGPFWAGNQTAAARMTDNGVLFIGTSPHEHTFLYSDSAMRARTSFLPDTFDSPMKLGPLDLSPRGEMSLGGRSVRPQDE